MRLRLLFFAAIVSLSACVGPPEGQRPRVRQPIASPELRQCLANLKAQGVRAEPLADAMQGGGCEAISSVQIDAIGSIRVTNTTAMRCPLAQALASWVRYSLRPAAREFMGSDIARVETMGTYACRRINGAPGGNLSEHARANAIDVSAFVLADGRRISVLAGWTADADQRAFLRAAHSGACRTFKTVLGPDYNAAHRNHFHFDLGRGPYCR